MASLHCCYKSVAVRGKLIGYWHLLQTKEVGQSTANIKEIQRLAFY